MASLDKILHHLKEQQEADRKFKHLEPTVDDRDLKDLKIDDGAQQREDEDLERGAVLKGPLEPGEGDATPQKGDLAFLHYSIINSAGEILLSTRTECDGPGQPHPFVLGKGNARPLRGVELALATMKLKERCMLEIKADYAFLHPECTLKLPEGLRKDENIRIDVQLVRIVSGSSVRPVGDAPGVIKQILKEGTGWESPRAPFKVVLKLSARMVSSSGAAKQGSSYFPAKDNSSSGEGVEVSCSLGSGALPPSLEAGVCDMRRGEEAIILCPASLAVGGTAVPPPPGTQNSSSLSSSSSTSGTIAPTTALRSVEYTVTLLDFLQVRDLTGDGGATKCTLKKGTGEFPADCPIEDTSVHARIRVRLAANSSSVSSSGTCNSSTRGNSSAIGSVSGSGSAGPGDWMPLRKGGDLSGEIHIDTGMGDLPDPIDAAIRLMLPNEVSLVASDWAHAYGNRDDAPAALPPGSPLEFEIELLDFEKQTNFVSLGPDEKLDRADRWREQGNVLFKRGRFILARQKYRKAMQCIGQALDIETEEQMTRAKEGKISCLLNLAACAQREEAFGEAIMWCDKAISEDSDHAKAHFRRGIAQAALAEYESATEDLETARRLDPSTSDFVDKELAKMALKAKKAAEKQRREMSGFLS